MWKRVLQGLGLIGSIVLLAQVGTAGAGPEGTLQGAWQLEQAPGRAGLYLFGRKHYSMMAAATDRPDIVDTSKATADDLRALWNPMLGNAGIYEVAGNLVTIRPVVAKIPVVMKPGAYAVYEFHVDANKLTLTQRRNVRGPVENGATTRLVRVE